MILDAGEVITLDANGKDYMVVKKVNINSRDYYYLMTIEKPMEIAIVELLVNADGKQEIKTVTDQNLIDTILKNTSTEVDE